MKILDQNGLEIASPDLTLGHLEFKETLVQHHEAVEEVQEVYHYETVCEYPNGGKDVQKVIDVPGVQAVPAWDEEIPIYVYTPYTEDELAEMEAQKEDMWAELAAALQEGVDAV